MAMLVAVRDHFPTTYTSPPGKRLRVRLPFHQLSHTKLNNMCIFQRFIFLCGCDKLKILRSCDKTSINAQGQLFCLNDSHPHIDDSIQRQVETTNAWGPGVCANINCRWRFAIVPKGMFDYNDKISTIENDSSFDMSEEACIERETHWFRTLTTDQQLEHLGMIYPRPSPTLSLYARAWFHPDAAYGAATFFSSYDHLCTSQLKWYELNPRYMSEAQLSHVTGFLLPASVTLPGDWRSCASTPLQPTAGPFAVPPHQCFPPEGNCKRCGRNHGDPVQLEKVLQAQADSLEHSRRRNPRPSEIRTWINNSHYIFNEAPSLYVTLKDIETVNKGPSFTEEDYKLNLGICEQVKVNAPEQTTIEQRAIERGESPTSAREQINSDSDMAAERDDTSATIYDWEIDEDSAEKLTSYEVLDCNGQSLDLDMEIDLDL